MKIFVNSDDYNGSAILVMNKLIEYCSELEIQISDNPHDADFIISIGGDGTFLKSASLSSGKAIIGINCGTLGYLTEINPDNLKNSLIDILNGNYRIEEHMMLDGEIIS